MDRATTTPFTRARSRLNRRWSWALPVCALAFPSAFSHEPLAPSGTNGAGEVNGVSASRLDGLSGGLLQTEVV